MHFLCSALKSSFTNLHNKLVQVLGLPRTGSPKDDPDYQHFERDIMYMMQLAEDKLNISRDIYINNTETFNLPEFYSIYKNLTDCFNILNSTYNTAEPSCMENISQDVNQTILDSKYELDACTNLTHSWELVCTFFSFTLFHYCYF